MQFDLFKAWNKYLNAQIAPVSPNYCFGPGTKGII